MCSYIAWTSSSVSFNEVCYSFPERTYRKSCYQYSRAGMFINFLSQLFVITLSNIKFGSRTSLLQGSAADVAMCAMLEISKNSRLRELGWRLLLQVIRSPSLIFHFGSYVS